MEEEHTSVISRKVLLNNTLLCCDHVNNISCFKAYQRQSYIYFWHSNTRFLKEMVFEASSKQDITQASLINQRYSLK